MDDAAVPDAEGDAVAGTTDGRDGAGRSEGPGGNRRWLVAAGLAVLVVVVLGVGFLVARPKAGYTEEDARRFREACTAEGGEAVRNACFCLYERMVSGITYERYQQVDQELLAQRAANPGSPVTLPPDVDALRAACVAQVSGGAGGTVRPAPSAPVRGAEGPPASSPSS